MGSCPPSSPAAGSGALPAVDQFAPHALGVLHRMRRPALRDDPDHVMACVWKARCSGFATHNCPNRWGMPDDVAKMIRTDRYDPCSSIARQADGKHRAGGERQEGRDGQQQERALKPKSTIGSPPVDWDRWSLPDGLRGPADGNG